MNLKQIFSPKIIEACLVVVAILGALADTSKAQSNAAIIGYAALKLLGILAITCLPLIARHELLSPEARTKQWRSYLWTTLFIIFGTIVVFGQFIYSNFYNR